MIKIQEKGHFTDEPFILNTIFTKLLEFTSERGPTQLQTLPRHFQEDAQVQTNEFISVKKRKKTNGFMVISFEGKDIFVSTDGNLTKKRWV